MRQGLTADLCCPAVEAKQSPAVATFSYDNRAIQSPVLAEFTGLLHASTTRAFQAALPPETSRVQEMHLARQMLDASPYKLYYGEQKHTSNVAVVTVATTSPEHGHHCFPQTDALVTSMPGVTLAIQTADCAPIFLYDPVAHVIGLAHAGWKGTLGRIAQATVKAMADQGARPENIIAWLGPMACVCCYEVSAEFIESFAAEFSDVPADLVYRSRHLDLVSINASQLQTAGIPESQVHRSGICTIHQNDKFYSYRADNGTCGRILSLIALHRP